ncbi:alpha/beta fold hydrolase [Marinitenerispora sediminis]|uniref:Alpha/beta hydrolase n=1 Tax=Marinitenerispora sediminis TaxID=1931232 RepID=A0A368T8M2_9ACTN|nr:alpha/beta hydrolase [Marinitenerispora sediminis]RCV50127.1 alpha/beta hydrolase [Marinitenerispora sediminis]RCV54544.1 alpha/beta hydrolase [Marinitenerispora sediminis]RCV58787.1 alpha/beta hydrolase [Marinitenerispora sediminis]
MDLGVVEPERAGTTALPGGRRLGWAAWGPVDGRPVLFCSGAAMGRSLGFGAGLLQRLGVRLVAVDRPGLGASDPDPGRTLDSWARDVADLVAALGLRDPLAVGFSQGAPFALACAAAGVVQAVAVVSGQDDLGDPQLAGLLPAEVAGMVGAARTDPAGFEASLARSMNAETLWRIVMDTSSAADRAVYTDPRFEPAYRRALAEGFAQGAAGYARDLALTFGRWPFALTAITVPAHLWYGAHDPGATHSPDHGTRLSRRLPNARHHLLPDAGAALLWTHAEEVLAGLVAPI